MSPRKGSQWRKKMFRLAWLTQRGRCAACGASEWFFWRTPGRSGTFEDGTLHSIVWRVSNLELDHIEPLHRGGSNEFENLQLLCIDCHSAKTIAERKERAGRAREFA